MCNVDDDEKFSLSVERNGFFCGLHRNLQYISGLEVHIILTFAAPIHIFYSMD
jgi:hypothetical protein